MLPVSTGHGKHISSGKKNKNHLTLCIAPRIPQSQPIQVRIINGNRQLETQVKDRRGPCLSSFPFAHGAKWPPDCSPGFLWSRGQSTKCDELGVHVSPAHMVSQAPDS